MTTEERIEAKRSELMQIFAYLPADQLKVAGDLIRQAAFMAVMLEDLSATISENGATEEYNHGGGQCGTKVNSAVKAYNGAISKYAAIVNKLLSMIPAERIDYNAKIKAERETAREREEDLKRKCSEEVRAGRQELLQILAKEMTRAAEERGEISEKDAAEYNSKIVNKFNWLT